MLFRFKIIFLIIAIAFGLWLIDIYLDSIMLAELTFLELLKLHVNGRDVIFFTFLIISMIVAASALLKVIERGRKSEIKLQEGKRRLEKILATSAEGFWLIDNEAVTVDVNDTMCSIMRMERKDLLGRKVTDFLDSENSRILMEQSQLRLQGQKGSYEGAFSRPDGSSVPCIINCTLLFDDEGHKAGSFAMITDITERKQMEEELRSNEKKYRSIIENSFFGICAYDESGQCILANSAIADMIGATVGQMLSQNFHAIKSWQKSGLLDAAKRSLETGKNQRRTTFVATTFGKELWLDYVLVPYYEGGEIFLLFLTQDVTGQKQSEEALLKVHNELETRVQKRTAELEKANEELQIEISSHRKTEGNLIENEKRFRAAATTTADLIWEGNIEDNSLNWYGDIDSILGYDQNQFPRTISGHMDIIHPDDRDDLIKAVEKAIANGEDFYAEYRIRCKNGDYRYWDERGRAVGLENGKAIKWVGSVTDITERILSQELLKKNEEKFRKLSSEFNTLLDAITDRLVLLSPDLKILWSNRAFDLAINRKCDKDSEQHCYRICCSQSGPCDNCPAIRSFGSGKEESARIIDSEGRVLDKRTFPMFDESDQVTNVIEVSRDITARVKMENEAKLGQSRLMHANKMTSLGTLVSGVAHEINNPNSYIMSNSQVFSEIWSDTVKILRENHNGKKELVLGGIPFDELIELAPRLLDGINEGSVRIKNIIQSLKNFAKHDKSTLDGEIDIKKAIISSRKIIDNHITKHTDHFYIECENDIPLIKGSSQKIEQVIINLIMNALHSLPDKESGIRISAYFDNKEKMVVLTVKDEGNGMSPDIVERVTEPFFTTRIDDGGTGLGLPISYTIIEDHNGTMEFESESGSGTTVTITLPASN